MERNAEPFILLFDWLPRTGLRLIDQFVYGFLVRCAWESGGVARPQQAAVATHFKVSRHTVVRSLKRLEAASVITTTRHQSGTWIMHTATTPNDSCAVDVIRG
jgi:Helix-turn-helix domain